MNTQNLDTLKSRLDAHRPLPPEVVKNLREDLALRWTYNSNAIEGNTLTLQETKVVLEGVTVGGKSIAEHLEATNHAHAINLVYALVEQGDPLDVRTIKEIHSLILKGIDDRNAGVFRTVNVTISGAEHVPPDFLNLQDEMDRFMAWYNGDGAELHVVERAARVHVDFVKIHPFADGNGRTSRLLMNLELMKGGFPPVVFQNSERLSYYEALEDACVKLDYGPFLDMTEKLVLDSFKPYWFALGLDEEGRSR
ncbi:Fic family protein [Maridesulfovibrio sp.]|uniref:Fic family protein n=1 Tax=Maridesulfovibrio sp. TaxID=2795000 RepID=UPI003B0027DF